jgi:hypothetical protein
MVLTGDPFFVDQAGDHQVRICYTSQPPANATRAAQTLARAISGASADAPERPLVRVV